MSRLGAADTVRTYVRVRMYTSAYGSTEVRKYKATEMD